MVSSSLPMRPFLSQLAPYKPGEQIDGNQIIKLNTNENPFPAAETITEAIGNALHRLHLYPNPGSDALRRDLAAYHGVQPDQILVGNGSDEILRLLIQGFIGAGDRLAVVDPTYSLYPVIASQYEGQTTMYPLVNREELPSDVFDGKEPLFILPNPNPPIGTLFSKNDVARLCEGRSNGLVVIDEAYADFAPNDVVSLLPEFPNLAITRTFSKSFSLAGMRVGYLIGHVDLVGSIIKLKDSYNLNHLSQVAAAAAIASASEMRRNSQTIIETRERTAAALKAAGFQVPESHGNFFFAIHPRAQEIYQQLRKHNILVRYFDVPGLRDGIRVSIGTGQQMDRFLEAVGKILQEK